MQTVVELARVVRDRRTLPVKYPLLELVIIHPDPEYLSDVDFLKTYILDELNIKQLVTTTDKNAYGVKLRAEADHRVLGQRLKKDFKAVLTAIEVRIWVSHRFSLSQLNLLCSFQKLTDAQLTEFSASGKITVAGQELTGEDLRVLYVLDDKQLHEKFEAHSDNEVIFNLKFYSSDFVIDFFNFNFFKVIVLVDVTPDKSMYDEGLAREVVNRIQKLRKKAQLVPSDDIIVYISVEPKHHELAKVCQDQLEFIQSSIKQPIKDFPIGPKESVVIEENSNVSQSPSSFFVKISLPIYCSTAGERGQSENGHNNRRTIEKRSERCD